MSESRFADEGTLAYIAQLEADLHSTHARVMQNGKAVQEAERKLAVAREALRELACLGNGSRYGNSIGNNMAMKALAQIGVDE